jgi:hypothetical protein
VVAHSFVGVSWNGLCGGRVAVGTLLGPERTGEMVSLDIVERVSFSGPFLFPYHSFLVGSVCWGRRVVGFWRGVWKWFPVVV